MNPIHEQQLLSTRRQLFGRSALGLGTAALAGLLEPELRADVSGSPGVTHHKATARRVIYLFMSGGPSHLDLPNMRRSI